MHKQSTNGDSNGSEGNQSPPGTNKVLEGKVAIITGASRGIGRKIALVFAEHGANIVIAAKSVKETPELPGTIFSVAKEVEALGAQALPVQCDVRNDDDIKAVIDATIKTFGRIDILISNAGALWWKDVKDTPLKRYDLINQINSRATFAFAQAVLPYMERQGCGHIITMSPPVNLTLLKGHVAYLISKYGMTLLALGLAMETKDTGISVNALWPATMVESYATINHNLGDRSTWRKAEILADACLMIVQEDPHSFTGHALIDEDYMRSRGVTSFTQYRCDTAIEPPRISTSFWRQPSAQDAASQQLEEPPVKANL
eukprot:TRINITY_DN2409_c0_g2_i1.p1 TRINITY_DN2409_c0_g2~~TRINITY_DN2409_c0_g2_i1.p1  ORF type:complete len:338 (+),score=60.56 TRINITY_DN2409_c0_g2_i1:67-1014(+)